MWQEIAISGFVYSILGAVALLAFLAGILVVLVWRSKKAALAALVLAFAPLVAGLSNAAVIWQQSRAEIARSRPGEAKFQSEDFQQQRSQALADAMAPAVVGLAASLLLLAIPLLGLALAARKSIEIDAVARTEDRRRVTAGASSESVSGAARRSESAS